MSYAKRTDANHGNVVAELRRWMPEASVFDTSGAGRGFPDLVVGWHGKNYLFELKDPEKPASRRDLTESQKDMHMAWQGQIAIAHSAAEICAIIARENVK